MKFPSVTQILQPFVDFSMISEERLQAACERGNDVHSYLHSYVQGLYCPRPENAAGYCESGERWLDANVETVISAEREYTDKELGFCGHPDLLFRNKSGQIILPDYKTPVTESRTWPIQIGGAYSHLICKAHRYKPENVIPGALMLSPTGGTAKMRRYDRDQAYYFSLFLGLLNAARYFNDHKSN